MLHIRPKQEFLYCFYTILESQVPKWCPSKSRQWVERQFSKCLKLKKLYQVRCHPVFWYFRGRVWTKIVFYMYDCTNKSCLSHCYEHFGIKHVYNFLHLWKVLDATRCQNLAFFAYRDNFLNFNANLDKNADWDKDEITIILLKKNLFFDGMAKRSSDFEILSYWKNRVNSNLIQLFLLQAIR